jgi:7,8-didemethyl-8-hydroxy-5-deazariboflavin synthase CofG subunit
MNKFRKELLCALSLTARRESKKNSAKHRSLCSHVLCGYIFCGEELKLLDPARRSLLTDKAPETIGNKVRVAYTRSSTLSGRLAENPLSHESAYSLIRCGDLELGEIMAAAQAAKERFKPRVITYSRKVFLPLTNLCRDYCGYCTFRRDPGQPGAHTMTPDEVLQVAHAGERMGCTEALFSLGDKPELVFTEMRDELHRLGYNSTLQYLEAMCELVLRETTLVPHPNAGLLSSEWLKRLAVYSPSIGLMLETTSNELMKSGRAHDNAPDKLPSKRLKTIEDAGKLGIPFTTGLLIGIGETPQDRVDTLIAIRNLHQRYGHIQEVIVQNFRVKPAIPMHSWAEPTRAEMLRTVAVARLLMPDVNIQAPPNLSAPNYEELLEAGINDWGGVSPLTPDFINPEAPWPHLEQLRLRTESKGYVLKQRLPIYPEFVTRVSNRPGLLGECLRASVDTEGHARRAA